MSYILKCPYCGATLEVPDEYKNDKRLHCSLCNKDFDNAVCLSDTQSELHHVQKEPAISDTKLNKKQKQGLWVWGIFICIMLYYCGSFGSGGVPQIGDRVVTTKDTWGAIDEKTFDEIGDALVAGDNMGLYQLPQTGRAKFISKSSTGKVIHGSWTIIQIRFDDGSLYWVNTEYVKKK